MKHTHVIEASSAAEFKQHVHDLYHSIHSSGVQLAVQPVVAHTTTANAAMEKAHTDEAAASSTVKKTSKKKDEPAKAAAAAPVVVATAPVEASADDIFGAEPQPSAPVAVAYTMEDCQKRLQAVVAKHDIKKAKELLSKFHIAKLVELKPEEYLKFVLAADELT